MSRPDPSPGITPGPVVDGPVAEQDGLVRFEEQVRVTGSTVDPVGTVRLRTIVVTEEEQITVRVRREKLVVDDRTADELVLDGEGTVAPEGTRTGAADLEASGAADPDEFEIILHEERPVVTMEIVATERVRVRREAVTTQEQITTTVGTEHIDVDRSVG